MSHWQLAKAVTWECDLAIVTIVMEPGNLAWGEEVLGKGLDVSQGGRKGLLYSGLTLPRCSGDQEWTGK